MNYTLNQLHIFYTICQTLSISRAAEVLNLTQPAVSIQLKNFQNQFELPLTSMVGKRIRITEFGKEVAEVAAKILNETENLKLKTMAFKGLLTGKLRISVVSTGKYLMPYLLTDFLKLHPGVELVLEVTNKQTVVSHLVNDEFDLALVTLPPAEPECEILPVLSNQLFLIKSTRLEMDKNMPFQEMFNKYALIVRENGSGTRQTCERFLSSHVDLEKIKKMELTSNEAVKQAVLAGLGLSIMPLIGLKNEIINQEVSIVNADGLPLNNSWQLVWAKGRELQPVAIKYIEYLRENLASLKVRHFDWYRRFKVEI